MVTCTCKSRTCTRTDVQKYKRVRLFKIMGHRVSTEQLRTHWTNLLMTSSFEPIRRATAYFDTSDQLFNRNELRLQHSI